MLVDKLKLIYEPGDNIQLADVQAHLINQSEYQLYELSDAYLKGETAKALQVLRQIVRNRAEISLVLWIITQDIRRLIQLQQQTQLGTPFNLACQKLSIWTQKAQNYALARQRLTTHQLNQLLSRNQQLDIAIKSGTEHAPWQTIERMILDIGCATAAC